MMRKFSDEVCDLVSKEQLEDAFVFTGTSGGPLHGSGANIKVFKELIAAEHGKKKTSIRL